MANWIQTHGAVAGLALTVVLLCVGAAYSETPPGFVSIFNGENLDGWHIAENSRHGDSKAWKVAGGVIEGTQQPVKNGGILMTDKKYGDFEVSLDIKPDFGCDGGVLLRSNEVGESYQIMIDYLEGGTVAGVHGEGLKDRGFSFSKGEIRLRERNWQQYWKKDDWNNLRARIEGNPPRIQVWLNGHQTVDWTDFKNHLPGGATEGMIGLQVHRSGDNWSRWEPGGYHRFRNISIKEIR